jgi:hypothetical protein
VDQAVTAAAWYPPVGARARPHFHQKRDATGLAVQRQSRSRLGPLGCRDASNLPLGSRGQERQAVPRSDRAPTPPAA